MVNTKEFAIRLEKICKEHDLTSAAFAEKVDVGRATISHITSGRNKPSLDFVMKVVKAFPEVDLQWLLNGKGSFPKDLAPTSEEKAFKTEGEENASQDTSPPKMPSQDKHRSLTVNTGKIKRVVLFFEDGTFESYET